MTSTNIYSELGRIDLTNCNREPVQFIESIQNCGYLLAWDSAGRKVTRASQNLTDWGWDPLNLVGKELPPDILALQDLIRAHLRQTQSIINEATPFLLRGGRLPPHLIHRFAYAYQSNGQVIFEVEKGTIDYENLYIWNNSSLSSWLTYAQDRLQACDEEAAFCHAAAHLVREVSNYDRVNIYRFDRLGHGKVIGESCRSGTAKFLNLWFPSSDIPPMARRVFDRIRHRLIADTDDQPSFLICGEDTPPVDLTESQFRAVSPIHLEYLRNMGVRASLVISVHLQNKLWGLIACHHETPYRPKADVREILGKFGKLFSVLLDVLKFRQFNRLRKLSYFQNLDSPPKLFSPDNSTELSHRSFNSYLEESLQTLSADGVMVFHGEELVTSGMTPKREDCEHIRQLLLARIQEPYLVVNCLSELLPEEKLLGGMLGFLLKPSHIQNECVVWYRRITPQIRYWAGNPTQKLVRVDEQGIPELSPRKSYEKWLEEVKDESLDWTHTVIDYASIIAENIHYYYFGIELEESRQEITNQFLLTLNMMSDGFIVLDPDWKIKYLNPTAEKSLRSKASEIIGRSFVEIFPPSVNSPIYRQLQQTMETGITTKFEEYCGVVSKWFEYSFLATKEGLIIFARDIDSRKKTEISLRDDEERLRLATQATSDYIWDWDLGKDQITWSHGIPFGDESTQSSSRTLGKDRSLHIHPEDAAQVMASLHADIAGTKDQWHAEYRWLGKNQTPLFVEDRAYILRDSGGKALRLVGGIRDITERKMMAEHYSRVMRQESLGTMAGGMAHDLNNLLSPILIGTELLKQLTSGEKLQRIVANMERNALRGAQLVRNLLAFTRGEPARRELLDIGLLMEELNEIILNTFPNHIRFEIEKEPSCWLVEVEPTQIHQVLLNLCLNSRDAMPQGGRLSMRLQNITVDQQSLYNSHLEGQPGDYLLVQVTDTGAGIPPQYLDKIFEPFFTTKPHGKGTGLGLATTAGIVRAHNGLIAVDSILGHGTTFRIYLPAIVDPNVNSSFPLPSSEILSQGQGESILVVDDEETVLEMVKEMLTSNGYKVMTVRNGAEALELFNRTPQLFSAVLTDIIMPIMDGALLIQELRTRYPQTPIVVASGYHDSSRSDIILSAGIKHFLPKPYSPQLLLNTLAKLLRRTGPSS